MKRHPLLPVLALSLGVFGIITTEMGAVGLLPEFSARFGTTSAATGWLVSVFALVVAVTGPFTTLLASRFNRKHVLLATTAVFVASNLAMAAVETFDLALVFRIVPAIAHPVFFAVAITSAARIVAPEAAAGAITKVFAGVTLGFAFGVPLSSFVAEQFSLSAALIATAAVNALALFGIWAWMPSLPAEARLSYGSQVRILRSPALWLNIAAITLMFAAMFAGFSFFASYLGTRSGFGPNAVSALLAVFGVVMVGGNFAFGALLQRNRILTIATFPALYVVLYAAIALLGGAAPAMIALVVVWGFVHAGGLLVSQSWLAVDAASAPEFGNSLFISFTNLGITIGTAAAGFALTAFGPLGIPSVGIGLSLLAAACIAVRLVRFPVPASSAE